jgi:hypothetical protein
LGANGTIDDLKRAEASEALETFVGRLIDYISFHLSDIGTADFQRRMQLMRPIRA